MIGKTLVRRGSITLIFEPRDVWIGVYWDRTFSGVTFYVCLIPCLAWRWHSRIAPLSTKPRRTSKDGDNITNQRRYPG